MKRPALLLAAGLLACGDDCDVRSETFVLDDAEPFEAFWDRRNAYRDELEADGYSCAIDALNDAPVTERVTCSRGCGVPVA